MNVADGDKGIVITTIVGALSPRLATAGPEIAGELEPICHHSVAVHEGDVADEVGVDAVVEVEAGGLLPGIAVV